MTLYTFTFIDSSQMLIKSKKFKAISISREDITEKVQLKMLYVKVLIWYKSL